MIENSLTQLTPNQADVYAQNARPVTAEIAKIDAWSQSQIQTISTGQR